MGVKNPPFLFMKKLTKPKDNRPQKFIELAAQGVNAYQSAIQAGYSEKYAKTDSHKLLEKYEKEIEALKPVVKEVIKEEIKYSIKECFNEFEEIRKLALLPNQKGDYCNLAAATKAVENKGKLVGAYEVDNEQKKPQTEINNIVDETKIKNVIKTLNNISNE